LPTCVLLLLASAVVRSQPLSDPTFFDPRVVSHQENYTLETNCVDPKISVTAIRTTGLVSVVIAQYLPDLGPGGLHSWKSHFTPLLDAALLVACSNGVTYSLTKRFPAPASPLDGTTGYMSHLGSGAENPPDIYPAVEQRAQLLSGNQLYAYSKARSPLDAGFAIFRPYEQTSILPIVAWEGVLRGLDFGVLPARDASLRGRLDRPVLLVHGRGRDYRNWGVEIARPSFENLFLGTILLSSPSAAVSGAGFQSAGFVGGTGQCNLDPVSFRKARFESRVVPRVGVSESIGSAVDAALIIGASRAEIDAAGKPWIVWGYTVTKTAYDELQAIIQADPNDERVVSLLSSARIDGVEVVAIEVRESRQVWNAILAKIAFRGREIAFQKRWVQNYQDGTLPDILARARGLDTRFDPADPASGINHNGIYFHNAPMALDADPRPVSSQYMDLKADLERSLNDHYGSSWRTDASLQIDIVCHSQGCLIVRDLLRKDSVDQGALNASNHIRKIVSVNSPHFGSALVSTTFSDEEQRGKYEGATGVFRDLLFNEHRIANGEADFGNASFGVLVAKDWASSIPCETSEATACGVGQAIAVTSGFFTGLLGRLFGAYDVNFTLDGKLLGPWKWDVRTRGESVKSDSIQGNPTTQAAILTNVQAEADLGQNAPFIKSLSATGFPTRPEGSMVKFLPFYSASTRDLTAQIASQIAHDMVGFCEEDYVRGRLPAENTGVCFSIAGEVESYANELAKEYETKIDNVRITREVREGLRTLRETWLSTSDLLVEAESQNPTGRGAFDVRLPDVRAAMDPARNFPLRRGLARGSRDTMVVHGPFQIEDNPVGTGPLMRQRGALRMGLDLYCALDQVCDTYLAKANVTFPVGHAVAASEGSGALLAARSVVAPSETGREYTFVGDFDQAVLDLGNNLQRLGVADLVQVQRQDDDLILACVGHKTKVLTALGPASLWVRRVGDVLTVGLSRPDGGSWSQDLPAESGPIAMRLVWNGNGSSPLLAGTGNEVDSPLQTATGGALVVHREAAPDVHASLPQGLVYNGTSDTIRGFELAYHFSADPSRRPRVEALNAPDAELVVEFLGGEDWRLLLRSSTNIAPGRHWPNNAPWGVRLSYEDGSTWNLWDDPSRYRNLGLIAENPWIPLRDGRGTLLWGEVPPSTLRTALDPAPHMEAWARLDPGASPWMRPQVKVKNLGSRSLGKIRMTLPFRVPNGRTPILEDWYTPEASMRLLDLGAGSWELEVLFDQHLIGAGSAVDLGEWGIRLNDWSNWSGRSWPSDWQADSAIRLWDSAGVLLWGREADTTTEGETPSIAQGTLGVELRDESPTDPVVLRPRVRLTWQGNAPLEGFRLRGQFVSPSGATPALDLWFPPQCTGAIVGSEAVITCADVSLTSGALWPDQAGAVFGLHHADWSAWDRSDDPSFSGLTGTFQPWDRLRVERLDGTCLAGCGR